MYKGSEEAQTLYVSKVWFAQAHYTFIMMVCWCSCKLHNVFFYVKTYLCYTGPGFVDEMESHVLHNEMWE